MINGFLATAMIDPALGVGAQILGLGIAVIFHEVAHGYVALKLGDPTAYYAGRLSLNPVKHIDPFGTIILPLLLTLANAPVIGWAKPVPVNYYNLRNGQWGPALVALAGPLTNFLILAVASLLARFSPATTALPDLFGIIALINGWLMMFNLLPIPPLDGSKVLYLFLEKRPDIVALLERYGFYILLAVFFLFRPLLSYLTLPILYLVNFFAGSEVLARLLAYF